MGKESVPLNLYVDRDLKEEISKLAEEEGLSVSELLVRPFKSATKPCEGTYRRVAFSLGLALTFKMMQLTSEQVYNLYKEKPDAYLLLAKNIYPLVERMAQKFQEVELKAARMMRSEEQVAISTVEALKESEKVAAKS